MAPHSPQQLLSELAAAVALKAICVTAQVREAWPQIAAVAERLELAVTASPAGDEDLLCVTAAEPPGDAPARAEPLLARFERTPFLLVVASDVPASSAVAAAAALLDAHPSLLARAPSDGAGAVLLADGERLLEAEAMQGEWRSAAGLVDPGAGGDDGLAAALWSAGQADRASIEALAGRIGRDAAQLHEARLALDRARGEIARLREGERRDVARLQLALAEEQAWVADQARRIATSLSWRSGHRLVRIGRRLTLRSDRGTDLPTLIAQRMDEADRG